MRVVTFNLHAGVDGWGRRTAALATALDLAPDLLIAPETWRGDDGDDFVATLAEAGLSGEFAELARAERVTGALAGRGWQPWSAHLTGEHGLHFTEHRALTQRQRARRDDARREAGAWGLGLFTRLPLDSVAVEPIERLPRERVRRAAIVARLRLGERPFGVVAVHGAHLSHGSFIQYRRVRELVAGLDPALPVILGGDFNSWRPPLRAFLPGWADLARARTWPARHPHSQIDHLLARGPWRVVASGSRDGGS
ncbi:MAG TPA: endonuclease/exonuclease/phosphatase family protein, partial [Acidimicrobiales bacterium]|nr:endonuclease/exonuclease/phosphatase family protein [Acidimicrobiales bacterium]